MSKPLALLIAQGQDCVVDFAELLVDQGFGLLSAGETIRQLREHNLKVQDVEEITEFREILNGRVRLLHPLIFASILARVQNDEDSETIKDLSLPLIEVVAINPCPVQQPREAPIFSEQMSRIDIAGPALLRAAAMNYDRVLVVPSIFDYAITIQHMDEHGNTNRSFRRRQAMRAFSLISDYDRAIAAMLEVPS